MNSLFWCVFFIIILFILFRILGIRIIRSGSGEPKIRSGEITRSEAMELEYPYFKYSISESDIKKSFEKIREFSIPVREHDFWIPLVKDIECKYKGASKVLVFDDSVSEFSKISDYFNETCRVKCIRLREPSNQLIYWKKNKANLINECLRKYGTLTIGKLSDTIYDHVRGCLTFNAAIIAFFIKEFNAKKVLDISAGWGDRLIGAIGAGAEYLGVDPNSCLHPGYREIIRLFAGSDSKKYQVLETGFETAKLPDQEFDLVMSSPPYFSLETYSQDPGQSINKFRDLKSWYSGFLIPSIRKAWRKIRSGGHMVLYMNNMPGKPDYVKKMLKEIQEFPDSEYLGIIGLMMKKEFDIPGISVAKPIWIWRKK